MASSWSIFIQNKGELDGLGMQREWDIREENIGFVGKSKGMRRLCRPSTGIVR